ncbi:MAG: tetratricopeptide repeat protein [Treponema sp.]|nr:tetratricopeptide repeat protein [Treponema sp.]
MAEKNILKDGIEMYRRGDYSSSLAFFLSLPDENDADKGELAYYIGLCYAKMSRYEDALLYLEQVVTSTENLDRILQCRYILAVIYANSGRKRLAEFELNKLLESGYNPSKVYASLAYVYWARGENEKSIEFYKKSLEIDADNPTALNGIGYVLACQNKDLTMALSYCRKALEHSPDSAAYLDSIGWVYLKLGLDADALKYLSQAQEKLPGNAEIARHLKILQEK